MRDREDRCAGLLAALALAVLVSPAPVQADAILFESASLGTAGQTTGYSIYSDQFQGARFSLSQAAEVTQIGGHMLQDADTSLFGAIVRLSGPTAFPIGSPFDASELVATTTFHAGFPSGDFLTPLSASLEPGDYALIFGAGLFGSPGNASGLMSDNNTELSGVSFFYWAGPSSRAGSTEAAVCASWSEARARPFPSLRVSSCSASQ